MNARQLDKLGVPQGAIAAAQKLVAETARAAGLDRKQLKSGLAATAENPERHVDDPVFGELARSILDARQARTFIEREEPAPVNIYGRDLEEGAVAQMHNA